MQVKHVLSELAAKPEGTFLELMPFNGRAIGACHITGTAPVWEMHPDTDEFFFILEGEFEITLLIGETPEHVIVCAGSAFVIPQGIWHKSAAPRGAKFIYLTPGEILHSEAEDPRRSLSNN